MGDIAGTTLEAPAAAPAPARERRWGLIALLIGVAVILVSVGGSGSIWAAGYAPLVAQGTVSVEGATYVAEGADPTSGLDTPRYQVPFEPGATHAMVVGVQNDGPQPIEVLGVAADAPLPLMPFAVVGGRPVSDVGGPALTWPQTLQPGDVLLVEVDLRIGSCHSSGDGTTTTLGGLTLRTRTLWFEKQADLVLLTPVSTTVDQSHCTG
jgi:hypothetical protein